MDEPIEHMASGREELQNLETEDKYVFHGSENSELDSLEPRQAYNYRNDVQEPDGDPAVFASSKADYSIMMALINKKNCPKGYRSSTSSTQKENGDISLTLRATKDSIEQLNDESFGYVYIFDKNLFQKREGGVEYVSKVPVSSVNKVRVIKSDLPPYIEVFEE
jgi:hypothetical protein